MDIDRVLTELNFITAPSTWLITVQNSPEMGESIFKSCYSKWNESAQPFLPLVLWIRHHWLVIFLQGNVLYVADSAPGVATFRDLKAVAELLATFTGNPIDIVKLHAPRQPRNSVECGLHVIVNTLLFEASLLVTARDEVTDSISYEPTQNTLQLLLSQFISREGFTCAILDHLAKQGIPLLSPSEALCAADTLSRKGITKITILWIASGQIQEWRGSLIKRYSNNWNIDFPEHPGYFSLPRQDVTYLQIKSDEDDEIFADLTAKNVSTPSNTTVVEGDILTIGELRKILHLPYNNSLPALVSASVAKTTRQHHLQILRSLLDIPTAWDNKQVSVALTEWFSLLSTQRGWRASTLLTKLASLQGALKMTCFYHLSSPSVRLAGSVWWRTHLKGASIAASEEVPVQAAVATQEDINSLLTSKLDGTMKAVIEMCWVVAGRIGDILQLTPEDINLDYSAGPPNINISSHKAGHINVRFRVGKTARRGTYSIAMPLPTEQTIDYLTNARKKGYTHLFPCITSDMVKNALRQVRPELECRSLRRGRLQQLSAAGLSDTSLLHVSRHAGIAMLRRYLDFGTCSGENVARAGLTAHVLNRSLHTLEEEDPLSHSGRPHHIDPRALFDDPQTTREHPISLTAGAPPPPPKTCRESSRSCYNFNVEPSQW